MIFTILSIINNKGYLIMEEPKEKPKQLALGLDLGVASCG